MNAGTRYCFKLVFDICKQTHQKITQTISAEFEMKKSNILLNILEENNSPPHFRAYEYCPRLTKDEISQQSADQLSISHFNPVEFDGFRRYFEVHNPEFEKGESS